MPANPETVPADTLVERLRAALTYPGARCRFSDDDTAEAPVRLGDIKAAVAQVARAEAAERERDELQEIVTEWQDRTVKAEDALSAAERRYETRRKSSARLAATVREALACGPGDLTDMLGPELVKYDAAVEAERSLLPTGASNG